MKRILLLGFLFFYSAIFSHERNNPFYTSENETSVNYKNNENQFATADDEKDNHDQNLTNGTGPPGDDDDAVPIDHYLPFLVVVAVAIIGYIGTKKRTSEI